MIFKISFQGRTKEEAFKIGEQMADEVTKLFPKPVKLKFEKVMGSSINDVTQFWAAFSYPPIPYRCSFWH